MFVQGFIERVSAAAILGAPKNFVEEIYERKNPQGRYRT